MSKNIKDNNLKEKLQQALNSTEKVISGEVNFKERKDQNKSSKKFDFFNLENLNSKNDFIKARAESDSAAWSNSSTWQESVAGSAGDGRNDHGDITNDHALITVLVVFCC